LKLDLLNLINDRRWVEQLPSNTLVISNYIGADDENKSFVDWIVKLLSINNKLNLDKVYSKTFNGLPNGYKYCKYKSINFLIAEINSMGEHCVICELNSMRSLITYFKSETN
jgi:hypothetical protein